MHCISVVVFIWKIGKGSVMLLGHINIVVVPYIQSHSFVAFCCFCCWIRTCFFRRAKMANFQIKSLALALRTYSGDISM